MATMNKGQKQTAFVVLASVVFLLGWEGITLLDSYPNNTISEIMWKAFDNRILVFLYGVVSGHWVWQKKEKK